MTLCRTYKRRYWISARGFTLIELLVSVIAGMLVAATAFSFSKHSTRLFAQEARIASTQMSVLTGFQRLQNDVARASYMFSPSLVRDVTNEKVCPDKDNALWGSWPDLAGGAGFKSLRRMAGLRIDKNSSTFTTKPPAMTDGSIPDAIRITGNMGIPEDFAVASISSPTDADGVPACAPNFTVRLSERANQFGTGPWYGAILRSGLYAGSDADKTARMQEIFRPGRFLRYAPANDGRNIQITLITQAGYLPNGQGTGPYICTASGLSELRKKSGNSCGWAGNGGQAFVNPVSVIEYSIGRLTQAAYAQSIYAASNQAPDDASRTELIRREILFNPTDLSEVAADNLPTELVAEYAVDLRTALRVFPPPSGQTEYISTASAVNAIMTVPNSYTSMGQQANGPEAIRGVELRLVVRNMERDRSVDIDPATGGIAAGKGLVFRYPLPTPAAPAAGAFARTRTLMADVALLNQTEGTR